MKTINCRAKDFSNIFFIDQNPKLLEIILAKINENLTSKKDFDVME